MSERNETRRRETTSWDFSPARRTKQLRDIRLECLKIVADASGLDVGKPDHINTLVNRASLLALWVETGNSGPMPKMKHPTDASEPA